MVRSAPKQISSRPARRAGQKGIALITVLWASALLAILVAGILAATRTQQASVHHMAGAAEAKALAEGGVYGAIHALLTGPGDDSPSFNAPYAVTVGSGAASVRFYNEAGKIDLRAADPALLQTLLETCGLSADKAQAITAEIVRLRSAARQPAEAPRLGSVADLMPLAGLSAADALTLERVLTVHSGLDEPVPPLPPAVSVSLKQWFDGIGRADQDRFTAAVPDRDGDRIGPRYDVLEIVSSARGVQGVPYAVRAVIRLTRGARQPFVVLSWQRAADAQALRFDDAQTLQCGP